MRRCAAILIVTGLLAAPAVTARQRLTFEAISIKPYATTGRYSTAFARDGSFTATLPVERLIAVAFGIRQMNRIVGEPGWARTEWFEIEAKPAFPSSRAETLSMLQSLLEDRFGLVYRRDPNGQATVYALTVARFDKQLGPGLRPAEIECLKNMAPPPAVVDRQLRPGLPVPCLPASGGDVFTGGSVPMSLIASTIQLASGEEVVDRTGLSGNFDYYVKLPRVETLALLDPTGLSIMNAVEEQLGLRLQREDVPRDVFIVERVSRPN
jgi:uncharacterized protein (TIGR03435 family)